MFSCFHPNRMMLLNDRSILDDHYGVWVKAIVHRMKTIEQHCNRSELMNQLAEIRF